jgi:hypothetical protein
MVTDHKQDAPNYLPGIIAVMLVCVVTVILAAITTLLLQRENRLAEEGRKTNEGLVGFKYTL